MSNIGKRANKRVLIYTQITHPNYQHVHILWYWVGFAYPVFLHNQQFRILCPRDCTRICPRILAEKTLICSLSLAALGLYRLVSFIQLLVGIFPAFVANKWRIYAVRTWRGYVARALPLSDILK